MRKGGGGGYSINVLQHGANLSHYPAIGLLDWPAPLQCAMNLIHSPEASVARKRRVQNKDAGIHVDQNSTVYHTYPPPLAEARPRSEKSRQNNGSTPTPCLDKAMHACDTHNRKARAGLKPYTARYNTQATFQILPVLIHCRGHQVLWNRSPFEPSTSSSTIGHACPSELVFQ